MQFPKNYRFHVILTIQRKGSPEGVSWLRTGSPQAEVSGPNPGLARYVPLLGGEEVPSGDGRTHVLGTRTEGLTAEPKAIAQGTGASIVLSLTHPLSLLAAGLQSGVSTKQ